MADVASKMLQGAVDLIISRLPPETQEHIAILAKSGVELRDQLNRIEAEQAELRRLFVTLIETLQQKATHDVIQRSLANEQSHPERP